MRNVNEKESITQVKGEVHFEDMTSRNVLEKQNIHQFVTTTTPTTIDVSNKKFFECLNVGAITVTDFLNGSPGQRIYLLGDGFTTIQNGTLIFTNTGANKLLLVDVVYKFTFFPIIGPPRSHKWVEDE